MFSSTRVQRWCIPALRTTQRRFGVSATAFCFILFYCIWKPWSINLVFMFGRNSSALEVLRLCSLQTLCLKVLSHTFSIFFLSISLCLKTLVTENPGVWLQACGLSPPYFICIMRHSWLNCKFSPWLVLLQYVINICLFPPFSHILSVFLAFSWGLQIGWIRFYACFKALGVLFIGENYITALAKSLEDLSSHLSASSLPHLNYDTWSTDVCCWAV